MRVVHWIEHDQAYIYLREIEDGGVARTERVFGEGIDLDFDREGRLVGIGIDGAASRTLPPEVLATAERVSLPEGERHELKVDLSDLLIGREDELPRS